MFLSSNKSETMYQPVRKSQNQIMTHVPRVCILFLHGNIYRYWSVGLQDRPVAIKRRAVQRKHSYFAYTFNDTTYIEGTCKLATIFHLLPKTLNGICFNAILVYSTHLILAQPDWIYVQSCLPVKLIQFFFTFPDCWWDYHRSIDSVLGPYLYSTVREKRPDLLCVEASAQHLEVSVGGPAPAGNLPESNVRLQLLHGSVEFADADKYPRGRRIDGLDRD